jgi:hypothetical protein
VRKKTKADEITLVPRRGPLNFFYSVNTVKRMTLVNVGNADHDDFHSTLASRS